MSLAVKYRPKVWSDVVEQESVVKVLSKQLETRQFKNAYIFSGASGCGKTTNARIFANEINRGLGTPIEIDAASNSGVENMRTIIKSASERALDCEYKIIIVDECFTGDTLIFTADGHKRICDITEEDAVMTPLGFKKVSKVHKIKRKTNLMKIKLNNGNEIKVTENHLILTDNGWIKAKELVKGDKLIDETNVYSMWRDFPNNKYNQNDVFSQLWWESGSWCSEANKKICLYRLSTLWDTYPSWSKEFRGSILQILFKENFRPEAYCKNERKRCIENIYTQLCDLWEDLGRFSYECQQDLFRGLLQSTSIRLSKEGMEIGGTYSRETIGCYATVQGESDTSYVRSLSKIIREDEIRQPIVESSKCCENEGYEGEEWYLASMEGSTWREWSDYRTSANSSRSITEFVLGVSREWLGKNRGVPYKLQMRPSLSRDKVGDRGGWQFTQLERGAIERCKERGEDSRIWVEDIEIYESGNTREFRDCSEDYSTVYDLSVEGCPMYFANGVLVHNCHSLSAQAWQSLLKTIEETPKYTIFIFCTTNPEKIPATIINRCQRFSFTRISTEGIKRRLCQILCNENVGETMKDRDEVTDYIARISKGEMRNAITMLETVIDAGSVDIETCIRVLGSYSYDDYINLTNYLLDGNLTGVSSVINFVYSSGVDMKLFTNTYLSFIMDVLKYCYSRNISNTKIPVNFENEIIKLVDFDNSANYYQYYMDNLLKLKNMIKGDDDPLTTIEIVFNQIGRLI